MKLKMKVFVLNVAKGRIYMTTKELSQIKEGDVIYDESAGIAYDVIKIYKSGLLTDWRWTNSYGRFIENHFLTYEELLCKDMMLIRGDEE